MNKVFRFFLFHPISEVPGSGVKIWQTVFWLFLMGGKCVKSHEKSCFVVSQTATINHMTHFPTDTN